MTKPTNTSIPARAKAVQDKLLDAIDDLQAGKITAKDVKTINTEARKETAAMRREIREAKGKP